MALLFCLVDKPYCNISILNFEFGLRMSQSHGPEMKICWHFSSENIYKGHLIQKDQQLTHWDINFSFSFTFRSSNW